MVISVNCWPTDRGPAGLAENSTDVSSFLTRFSAVSNGNQGPKVLF